MEFLDDGCHSVKFTLNKYRSLDSGKTFDENVWASATHIIRPCEISDQGWVYENGERFEEPLIQNLIKKVNEEYWNKEVIDEVQLEIERQYVEKYMQFNAGDGAVSLDEINEILESMGIDDEITKDIAE